MSFILQYTKYLSSLYVYAEDDKDEDNDEVDDEEEEEDEEVLLIQRKPSKIHK